MVPVSYTHLDVYKRQALKFIGDEEIVRGAALQSQVSIASDDRDADIPVSYTHLAEKAKQWIANGAQPTDTVRVLLNKSNVL